MSSALHGPVRVRDPKTGNQFTTTRPIAQRDGYTVLEGKPAVNPYSGRWLPPKRKTTPKLSAPTETVEADTTPTKGEDTTATTTTTREGDQQ